MELDPTLNIGKCLWCGSEITIEAGKSGGNAPQIDAIYEDRISPTECRKNLLDFICDNPYMPDELFDQVENADPCVCFIPGYFFQADWHANWNAESGHDSKNEKGETVTEWTPVNGQTMGVEHYCSPANAMIVNRQMGDMFITLSETLPRDEAKEFNPEMLEGKVWLPSDYSEEDGFSNFASERLDSHIESVCEKQIPGDQQRNLRFTSEHTLTAKRVLIPCCIFSYTWKDQKRSIIQDAYQGKIVGDTPKTVVRLLSLIILVIFGLTNLVSSLYLWNRVGNSTNNGWMFSLVSLAVLVILPGWYHLHCLSVRKGFKNLDADGRGEASKKLKKWERSFMIIALILLALICGGVLYALK
ncbi:MAG: hypothetical protein LBM70_02435 [Victivallales bacterium]|jgi:hypothetical protein|nr:hypothetical protein [Victivallales bacterium]